MESIKIFGVTIHNTTLDDTTKLLEQSLKENKLKVIYTPNTEIIMAAKGNNELRDLINKGDLILPDGIGLIYGSRIKKKPLKERVTGFDTSMKLLDIANKYSYSIYLLGGKDGIAKEAAKRIKADYPNINIAGFHHGYFKGSHLGLSNEPEEEKIIKEINEKKPDIIFVGFGFPKQEIWIDANRSRIDGKVIIGNGGVMDILSGNSRRAPEIYIKLGLEWLYRLMKEPSRIKRQIVLPKFLIDVIFSKNAIE
ncbi:WecB/TagA/CpsF family glycosyltransferase [Tissierella sp. Yu-01]|uniref:WecB/TagA/CpsF family glycosyltransferase n=1 Tax=Tissierella sp. Yu-01 TaxID=3035694 RepID=UPI00240D4351|nr:WecB/TagA/CpsF family glycosyltransferase [Tissierella sp. Yu-01]WFA09133.1 WecB/TagA/CpsF family glycosyltransferase [Tissierella sp. Yu-01]